MITRMPMIAVVGAGTCSNQITDLAEQVGATLAQQNITVVCGGLDGVMAAACRGAKSVGGQTIGILPGRDPQAANPWVDVVIATGLGEARNTIIVHTAQALIAIGGEFGTLSEIAFALKLGKPVIGLQTWQLAYQNQFITAIQSVSSASAAVELALAQIA
ncbi:MAG: TIGR00725 family protein [Aphanocapsa sp. GSE-SYN-MK-11-07L]|jgi:hypothetical protein|nr:TIGR00725 family protein [Aphanocapsa sp. GSE-SYN-MK-11-07L]